MLGDSMGYPLSISNTHRCVKIRESSLWVDCFCILRKVTEVLTNFDKLNFGASVKYKK